MDDIRTVEGGFLLTRSYLAPTPSDSWIMIDAPGDADRWLDEQGILPKALILTHQHFDHVMTAASIQKRGVPIYAWQAFDRSLTIEEVVREWGMPFTVPEFEVDHVLRGQDHLEIEGLDLKISHLPGHSTDSIILFDAVSGVVYAGDTLFAGSTGRPDLPGGDMEVLCKGIRDKIYTLPPTTRVLPGHGGSTTVGKEANSNPIVRSN